MTLMVNSYLTTINIFFFSFQMLSDPLTVEQLQMISNNDKAEMEDIKNYESNGFMPIKLYQEIGPNNRFKIIRKLGFGTYSTVWMCKDELRYSFLQIGLEFSNKTSLFLGKRKDIMH